MNKVKVVSVLLGLTSFVLSACHPSSTAKIEGTLANMPNDSLTLYRLNLSELVAVDSVVTNSKGKFSTHVKMRKGYPEFYYLKHRDKTLSSLLVLPGDRISLTIDTLMGIYTVKGSQETERLHEAEVGMTLSLHRFDSLANLFLQVDSYSEEAMALNYAMSSVYVKQKQAAIRFIFTHPYSMASVHVLFQQFSDQFPVFADMNDALYFERLYDSLRTLYPKSPYIAALRDQSEVRKRQIEINDKLIDAQELGFPEIRLPDVSAQPVFLSQLRGKVIILSFWLSQDPRQRIANQDLLELYRKYSSKGLQIYQVALDSDKTSWARTVAEQELPWISVCDGYGAQSPAVSLYAVSQVPTHFLIDKNGDIVGRDFTLEQLTAQVDRLCR